MSLSDCQRWWFVALISNVSACYSRARRGSPPVTAKGNTLWLCVSLCGSAGISQRLNCAAVLSRPHRSVFVGRVAAAGSCGDGRESGTPRQRGVWCGFQCRTHAQVSERNDWNKSVLFCVVLISFFKLNVFPRAPALHKDREYIAFFVERMGGLQFFCGGVKRSLCARERALLSAGFIHRLTLLLSHCDLLGCTV